MMKLLLRDHVSEPQPNPTQMYRNKVQSLWPVGGLRLRRCGLHTTHRNINLWRLTPAPSPHLCPSNTDVRRVET